MIKFYTLLIFIIVSSNFYAQMDRETRAVWLATNFRLDWPPPTYDADKQQQALLEILDFPAQEDSAKEYGIHVDFDPNTLKIYTQNGYLIQNLKFSL